MPRDRHSEPMANSVNAERRSIEKARGRFPGAGFGIFAMLKICR
jgi:hypothetical protein